MDAIIIKASDLKTYASKYTLNPSGGTFAPTAIGGPNRHIQLNTAEDFISVVQEYNRPIKIYTTTMPTTPLALIIQDLD